MKKKRWIVVLCIVLLAVCGGLGYGAYYWYHATKEPAVVADLCYGKFGRSQTESLVYVKENDKYIPYIVIDTDNYGKDAVLLVRKEAFLKDMMYRDENIYGASGAYYNGCIVDAFLEGEFYSFFTTGMQGIIRNTPIKIQTKSFVSGRQSDEAPLETINRHVFVLSAPECGGGSLIKDESQDEGECIPGIRDIGINVYTWLRSKEVGGDDTYVTLWYGNGVVSSHIQNGQEHYVRPVITVNRNEPIELRTFDTDTIKGTVYVFPGDE